MRRSRYKPVGWRGESYRHYLAAKGVKTKHQYHKFKDMQFETPDSKITFDFEEVEDGRIYPVSPEEVTKVLKDQKPEHLDGIKKVEFVNPKGIQKDAWAQYVRSRNSIKIFSQPFEDGEIDGQDADEVNTHIKNYVIPHEIGHHRALEIENITDKDIEMAETRADAHVFGFSPKDPDIMRIWRLRNNK